MIFDFKAMALAGGHIEYRHRRDFGRRLVIAGKGQLASAKAIAVAQLMKPTGHSARILLILWPSP